MVATLLLVATTTPEIYPLPTRRSSDLPGRRPPRGRSARTAATTPGLRAARRAPACRSSRRRARRGSRRGWAGRGRRSEEDTSELQSRENLVCRLLLEKKNIGGQLVRNW